MSVIDGVRDLQLLPAGKGYLAFRFEHEGNSHRFRMRRENGKWTLREYQVNDSPTENPKAESWENFEQLAAHVLHLNPRPKIQVIDVRCPEDPRRLFFKVVRQKRMKVEPGSPILEVSCPQCKRSSGKITMHYYNAAGEFLRSEKLDSWKRREPRPWFKNSHNGSPERRET